MILVVLHMTHIMLTGVGTTNGKPSGAAPPADCAALGTCAVGYPDPLYSQAIAGCGIAIRTMVNVAPPSCWWGNSGPAGGLVQCGAVGNPDKWGFKVETGGGDECYFRKALSLYPQGTYTNYYDDCGCGVTIDIYTD